MKVNQANPLQLVKTPTPNTRFADVLGKHVQPPPLPQHRGALAPAHPAVVPPGLTPRLHPAPLQPARACVAQAVAARAQVSAIDQRSQAHRSTQHVLDAARADANGSARKLSEVRVDSNAMTARLFEVRAEPVAQHPAPVAERPVDRRMLDLICRELKSDPGVAARPANQNLPAAADRVPFPVQVAQAHSSDGPARSAQAVELIEKIETFVRSHRPALALTLNNSLGARVEIERIGPREVALKVVGKDGPPKAEDLGRIREEMKARGLKVGALSVA